MLLLGKAIEKIRVKEFISHVLVLTMSLIRSCISLPNTLAGTDDRLTSQKYLSHYLPLLMATHISVGNFKLQYMLENKSFSVEDYTSTDHTKEW